MHLTTFDGGLYDFQGAGEFTLVKSTKRVKDPLEVQERLQNLSFSGKQVTWPTAVAMRVGPATVGFYANSEGTVNSDVTVRVNKRPVKVSGTLRLPGGGWVEFTPGADQYAVIWPDGSVVFVQAVNPLFPGDLIVSTETGTYGFSLLQMPAERTFPISVGTTVRPGQPKNAGDLNIPYTTELFTFPGTQNQKVTLRSLTACEPGTASEEDTWTLGTLNSAAQGGQFFEAVESQPLCHSLGAVTPSQPGTWAIEVNGPDTLGRNAYGQWVWGPQAGTGTFQLLPHLAR